MSKIIFVFLAILAAPAVFATNHCDRLSYVKNEIIQIAKQNTTNEDQFAETRVKLNELVRELQSLSSPVDENIIGQFSPGSWKQIWADEKNNDSVGGPQRDLNEIYQYVNPMGWAFNFGVRKLQNSQKVTFALRAQASVTGNKQRTEITAAFLRMSPLNKGESIKDISQQIYEGTSADFVQREAGRFPRGPIGAVGILELQYLDQDLKIGTTNNVFTGDNEMFVLERIEEI